MRIKGVPDFVERKFAASTFELGDYKTHCSTGLEIYEGTEDPRIKKIANNHIYRTKAALDIETLGKALSLYQDKIGKRSPRTPRLVTAGILPTIPKTWMERITPMILKPER